jgi:ribonuclease D
MSANTDPAPNLVDDSVSVDRMLAHLRRQPLVALDTESDSFYHYYPKVCLIQISAQISARDAAKQTATDYLVDPLRLSERGLTPLGATLASPEIEVVMHAAENDLLLLARDFGFVMPRVFDTQLAARILGWPRAGLAAILEERFGAVSNKRMQRTDWSRRPLTPEQMAYGAMDTHYLLPLREVLIAELKARGRWEEAQDAFAQLAQVNYADKTAEERTLWDMKATRDVPREHHGVMAALWEWREAEARRRDMAPFRILGDGAIVDLAIEQPRNASELRRLRSIGERESGRYGNELLKAIRNGQGRPLPPLPVHQPNPEYLLAGDARARYDALRQWRNEVAGQRSVALEIVFNNATLLAIVQRSPRALDDLKDIPGLSPWKRNEYGDRILKILRR